MTSKVKILAILYVISQVFLSNADVGSYYITWSPDGTKILGTSSNFLKIWDANGNLLIDLSNQVETVLASDWNPESTQLVTLENDDIITIWNISEPVYAIGEVISRFSPPWDDETRAMMIDWDRDGQKLYIAGGLSDENFVVWSIDNNQPMLITNAGWTATTSLSPDGQKILQGYIDSPPTVSLLSDLDDQQLVGKNSDPLSLIFAWSADSSKIGMGFNNGEIRLYDANSLQLLRTMYSTPNQQITIISFSPDGTKIVTSNLEKVVQIWDIATGNLLRELSFNFSVYAEFNPVTGELAFAYPNHAPIILPSWDAPFIPLSPDATFTPTETPIPPTATFTPTPIPSSPTPTATSVACTHTVVASSTSSLISAIVSANASSTPSTICLGGGTYTLTAVNNSDESANGLPSITKNITIIGNNSVIERATSAPQFRIFRVASNGRLSLNNLTVRGGHAGSLSGGGVRNLGILELNTVIVENNTGNAGGGIRNNNNATFTAINSLIRNNVSTTNGGGLYANNGSSTTLTNTNFLGNTTNASNGLGGAIFSNGNIFTMSGGIIQNNSARNGGGIFVNITTQAMSLSGVQFTGNTASNHGAGIYHLSGTTFSVQNGRFTSNIATNEGGAIAGDGTFTITNSNFLSNSANIGGAIHAQATSGSSIQQSCIENNTAPNTIGIFNEASVILNAQNNFWGSAGASASVSANVNTNGALMACGNP
jgi:predicted outer membrane repeat protein